MNYGESRVSIGKTAILRYEADLTGVATYVNHSCQLSDDVS